MPFDWLKKIHLCCLRHNKANVKNVSTRTMTYLKFVHFKVIFKCQFIFLTIHKCKKVNYKEWIQ